MVGILWSYRFESNQAPQRLLLQHTKFRDVLVEVLNRLPAVLPNFDNVAIRISHVTSQLSAVVIEWLGQELGALRLPLPVTGPNIGHTQVQKAVDCVRVARGLEKHFWLVRRRATTGIENEPRVSQLDITGVLLLYNFSS